MSALPKFLTIALLGSTGLMPAAASAQAFDPTAPREAVAAATERLDAIRPLPAGPRDLELAGEYARRSFAVHLTAAEASSARQLRLKIRERAVSVLPESASLVAYVNGRLIGGAAGSELRGDADLRLPLQPGSLVAGFNEIRIEARQEHRVDCSVDSGYELWTRLDPASTGLLYADDQPLAQGGDGLTDVLQTNGAPGALRLVLPTEPDGALVNAAVRTAQAVALAGRAWRPVVTVVPAPTDEAGTNILFRTSAALPTIDAGGGVELIPGVWALPRSEGGVARDIILVGESTAALDRLAASIAGSGDRTVSGTRDGLAVLSAAFGRPMAEEEPVPLAAFGVPTIDFAGRRMAEQVAVTLPADFFASGYGSVRLSLHGKYIPGLTHDSALRIRVNDVVAATVQLVSSGETWNGRDIELPLQMFHPGPNAVQLEVVTQTEADLVCDPAISSADASRIRLDARTSITFPRLARVGNLPEIGATMAAGYPYTATADPVAVWMTGRDAATVGAAATVATQLAVAQGRPMPVDLNFRAPIGTDAGGIVVATTNSLPDWLRSPMVDDPAFATDRESQSAIPKADLTDTPGSGPLEPVQIAPLAVYNDTLAGNDVLAAEDQDAGFFSHVEEFRRFAGSADWNAVVHEALVNARRKVADLATGTVRREIVLPGPSDLVVYQTADLPTGTSVSDAIFKTGSVPRAWTVFTAETTCALAAGIAGVAGEQRWNQISGRLTVVRHGESRIDAIPADKQVLTATRSFTFGNARLALAGWFSRNTILYVEVMLAVCVLLGAVGFVYSRVAGNRSS